MQASDSKTGQPTSLLQRFNGLLKNPWLESLLGLVLTSWFLRDFGIEQVIYSRAGSASLTWSSSPWYMLFWNVLAACVWIGCLIWLIFLMVKRKKQSVRKI